MATPTPPPTPQPEQAQRIPQTPPYQPAAPPEERDQPLPLLLCGVGLVLTGADPDGNVVERSINCGLEVDHGSPHHVRLPGNVTWETVTWVTGS
jgi:hypothetical protein